MWHPVLRGIAVKGRLVLIMMRSLVCGTVVCRSVEWDFVVRSKVEILIMVWGFVVEVVVDIMMSVMVEVWVVALVVRVVEVRLRMVVRGEETVKVVLTIVSIVIRVVSVETVV